MNVYNAFMRVDDEPRFEDGSAINSPMEEYLGTYAAFDKAKADLTAACVGMGTMEVMIEWEDGDLMVEGKILGSIYEHEVIE